MDNALRRRTIAIGLMVIASGTLLGGCFYRQKTTTVAAPPATTTTVITTPSATVPTEPQVVTYPNGRYELRGQGTPTSPYYWAWVPSGAAVVTAPTLPAVPTVVVTSAADRVRTYPEGQYQLAGEGTRESPYYWVWVPAGESPPPPPQLPRRSQVQ